MIGCIGFTTEVNADVEFYGNEALIHIKNLGIFPTSLEDDDFVTRADFAQAIYVMSGKNVVIPYEQLYYDVTTNDNFCNAVMYCSKNGYMVGSDGMFRPYDGISFMEAMTVMARVLNYTEYAQQYGGYAIGYYTVAKNIGLLNNTGMDSSDDLLDVKSCAVMLYNALRTSVNQLSAINPFYYVFETIDKIYAYDRMGLNYSSGIMTYNGYVDVSGKEHKGDTYVIIGDKKYDAKLMDNSARKYIGQSVSVFYDDDTKIVSIAPTGKSTVVSVAKENFDKKNGNTIQYYDNNSTAKAIVANKAVYIKNGKVVLDYKATGFDKAEYADINLIDGDGDGYCEYVIVNVYSNFVVSSISSDGILRSADNKYVLDLSEENKKDKFIYNADGEEKTVMDIYPECTISYTENADFIYVVYTDFSITGELMQKDEYQVIVDNYVVDIANNATDKLKNLSLGDRVTLYFDFAGRIVSAKNAPFVTGTGEYGFLIKAEYKNKFDKSIKLKIFTNSEEFKVYTLSSVFDIDDNKYRLNSLNGLPAEFYDNGSFRNCMIMYKVNSNDEVTEITFPKTSLGVDEDGFMQTAKSQKAYRISNGCLTNVTARADGTYFSGNEFLNSNTEIFVVPDDLANEEKYAIVSMADIPISTNFIWDLYHLSKYNGFVDIAVVYSDYAAVSYDTTLSIVLSVSKMLDEEGNEVVAIRHFSKGEVLSTCYQDFKISEYEFDSFGNKKETKISINSLKPGDGVRLTVGKNGNIRQGERIYEYNATQNAFKGSTKGGAYATHSLFVTSGYVAYNDKTLLRLADTVDKAVITDGNMFGLIGTIYSSAKIIVVEDSTRGVKVRAGTSADVEVGDYAIYQSRAGIAAYVIVYKDK